MELLWLSLKKHVSASPARSTRRIHQGPILMTTRRCWTFVAWALVNDPDALQERFALESMMSERGLTDNRMRYVLIILRVAAPLVAAYQRERASTS
jgi:hypothetical protein